MNCKLIYLCLIMLSSSIMAYEYQVKPGWQILSAVENIEDLGIFDNKCVDYIWLYDNSEVLYPEWKLHLSNGIHYSYSSNEIGKIDKGQGFWLKAHDECSIK